MIPLYSTAQIRELDNLAVKQYGIPGLILMENAAAGIFRSAVSKFPSHISKAGFVCGKGNNGGDGFAAARHFYNNGSQVTVIYTAGEGELSGDAASNFSILRKLAAADDRILLKKFSAPNDIKLLRGSQIIFEALLGSGAEGDLKEPYLSIVKKLNELNSFKVAVDIPAGLNADTGYAKEAFKADLTVTLAEYKRGLFTGTAGNYTGEVVKESIGIGGQIFEKFEVSDYLIEPEDVFAALPVKGRTINKYTAGRVLTIAGSGSYPGAAALTSEAALRTGAGASLLAFPGSVKNLIHPKITEVVVHAYDDAGTGCLSLKNLDELSQKIDEADTVALGPGLGRNPSTIDAVLELLRSFSSKKFIIDADALFALRQGMYRKIDLTGKILTPHLGEFSRLIDKKTEEINRDPLRFGRSFAVETGSYLLLKGAPSIIFTPDGEALINTTGNPGLAKFGTGDVLTGIIAGLAAQKNDMEQSAVSGAYIHGLTADILKEEFTEYCFTAGDISANIHKSIQFLRKSFA